MRAKGDDTKSGLSQRTIHETVRDPYAFRTIVEAVPGTAGRKLALGIDPGTTTGYAIGLFQPGRSFDLRTSTMILGQWDLSAGPYDSGAIRFVRLRQFLAILQPALLVFEEPKFTPKLGRAPGGIATLLGRALPAAELLAAYKATICTWAEEAGVPCQGFGIGEIKKRATGKGNAGKPEMILACNQIFGVDLDPQGFEATGADNMADAAFALLLGLEAYSRGA